MPSKKCIIGKINRKKCIIKFTVHGQQISKNSSQLNYNFASKYLELIIIKKVEL